MSEFLAQRANLSGKVAVVLGGAGGIGKAVSLALANAGVDVAICDRDGDAADSAREEFRALGQEGFVRVVDVTQPAALADFYAEAAASFARLDIVVNVVGGVRQRPFLDATPDHCAADIQRNYGYVLDSGRHAVPLIRRGARGGSSINFTTIEASRGAAGFINWPFGGGYLPVPPPATLEHLR